jgi:hypothetical protein
MKKPETKKGSLDQSTAFLLVKPHSFSASFLGALETSA